MGSVHHDLSAMTRILLIPLLACTTLVSARAEEKSFGGFEPGTEFTLTVKDRISTRTKGSDVDKNVPVPDGLPRFKEGRKLQLVIGKRGQLKGPGFSIDFRKGKRLANVYADNIGGSLRKGAAATVAKEDQEPVAAVITFTKLGFSGFRPVTHNVTYVLE